jgi:ABC-type dipeptide/oligopeptide/nickel transport system permease subunit
VTGGGVGGAAESRTERIRSRPPWRRALSSFLHRPFGVAALLLLCVLVAGGILARHLTPYYVGELQMGLIGSPEGPRLAGEHFFGTDDLGRDVFAQVLYGLHVSVVMALEVAGAATVFGTVVGAIAGYAGGWVDALLMRGVDLVVTIPTLAVLVVSVVYFHPLTTGAVGYVLMLTMWPVVARVVRASFRSLRELEYVEAAHAAGAGPLRIVVRHLLPNSAGVIVVAATSVMGIAITLESTVDFFQFGTQELIQPTLGNLVADGARYGLFNGARGWWTWAFPTFVLVGLLLCLNVVGDALDESLVSTVS